MRLKSLITAVGLSCIASMANAHGAASVNFSDRAVFLDKTQSDISIVAPIANVSRQIKFKGLVITPAEPFSSAAPVAFFGAAVAFSNALPFGNENFSTASNTPFSALGFDAFEPTIAGRGATRACDLILGCSASVFSAEIFVNGEALASFNFTPAEGDVFFFGVFNGPAIDNIVIPGITDNEADVSIEDGQPSEDLVLADGQPSEDLVLADGAAVPEVVPVPASLPLLAAGLGLLGFLRRKSNA
ncbi:MAG: PEP-CTERM sorting domain-containing protein [Litoreibacter sp.]